MSGGGYVTSYTDITELRRAAQALEEANEQLEARVADRTERLDEAKQAAEDATASKTRFLAAASHDLLQPLHAARLFIAALKDEGGDGAARTLADNADRSIESAHGMLKALLNLSKLEAGGVRPAVGPLSLEALFAELRREFMPLARAKGLTLRLVPSRSWVSSDRDLLRSLLQNLIGNAIRYTDRGRRSGRGAAVGRRRPDRRPRHRTRHRPRISARPSSPSSPAWPEAPATSPARASAWPSCGRSPACWPIRCRCRRCPVGARSSRVTVPRAEPVKAAPEPTGPTTRMPLAGLRVLCVDNEPAILEGLSALLKRWGMSVVTAPDAETALARDEGVRALRRRPDRPASGRRPGRAVGGRRPAPPRHPPDCVDHRRCRRDATRAGGGVRGRADGQAGQAGGVEGVFVEKVESGRSVDQCSSYANVLLA